MRFFHFIFLVWPKIRIISKPTDLQLQEMFRLRHEVYVNEKKYIDSLDVEIETDAYDDQSDFQLFYFQNKLIAVIRFIKNKKSNVVPALKEYELHQESLKLLKEPIIEVSRFLIIKEYRKTLLQFVMLLSIKKYAAVNNVKTILGSLDEKGYGALSKRGITLRKIGKIGNYQGDTFPVIIDVRSVSVISVLKSFL